MALRDDKAARAFGKAMIRDMINGEAARYAGWTMEITKGVRAVCCLPLGGASASKNQMKEAAN